MKELEEMLKDHLHKLMVPNLLYGGRKSNMFWDQRRNGQTDQYVLTTTVFPWKQTRSKRKQLLKLFRDVYPNVIFTCSQK